MYFVSFLNSPYNNNTVVGTTCAKTVRSSTGKLPRLRISPSAAAGGSQCGWSASTLLLFISHNVSYNAILYRTRTRAIIRFITRALFPRRRPPAIVYYYYYYYTHTAETESPPQVVASSFRSPLYIIHARPTARKLSIVTNGHCVPPGTLNIVHIYIIWVWVCERVGVYYIRRRRRISI